MEREVGDIFELYGIKYKVMRPIYVFHDTSCERCDLFGECVKGEVYEIIGPCSGIVRNDRRNIYFKILE